MPIPQIKMAKSGFVQPSRGDVHVNRPLTNISIAFMQANENFVADRAFPNLPVQKQSDTFFTYERGEFNRDEMRERAPATESAGGTYKLGTDTYFAKTFAFHKDIPDQVRANADDPINLDSEATQFVTLKGLIKREIRWRTAFFTPGDPGDTWTFDVDGVSTGETAAASFDPTSAANNDKRHWNDAASTPIEDIRQGKRFVLGETGFRPNILVLGRSVYDTLLDHPDIVGRLDRGQTTGPAMASRDSLAALFEVEEILIMDAIINTAAEGAVAVHSFIGGKNALLAFRPASPGLLTPSAGYTFSWVGLLGSTTNGLRIRRKRLDKEDADRIEADMSFDQKLISADLGYFFGGIVA